MRSLSATYRHTAADAVRSAAGREGGVSRGPGGPPRARALPARPGSRGTVPTEAARMTRTRILIALGANLPRGPDTPEATLRRALRRFPGRNLRVLRVSPFLNNPAEPPGSGPDFVNAVALVETSHGPSTALQAIRRIERSFGRGTLSRAGPRTLDLDLIAFGAQVRPGPSRWRLVANHELRSRAARPSLALPHPGAHRRTFVMGPLLAVAPRWRHPALHRSAASLCQELHVTHCNETDNAP